MKKEKNRKAQHLYAAYDKESTGRSLGSSGGVFRLLAISFLKQGYYVAGAAFDGEMRLSHRVIKKEEELGPLLKSKYIQSDTAGIYREIGALLKKGERVFFCGTPCQVSALKNSLSPSLCEGLFTADIICHGVPSQAMFDAYIEDLSAKKGGKISDFSFRVKDNRYRHSHGYSYTVCHHGKKKREQGIYTDSPFYNAFKSYKIFRPSCYTCEYATLERPSDITLGDFWGIEKYGFPGDTDRGVSMLITNTERGEGALGKIKDCLVLREYGLSCGIESNHCLTHTTQKPAEYEAIMDSFRRDGWAETAARYFSGGKSIMTRIYWAIPPFVRRLLRKIR